MATTVSFAAADEIQTPVKDEKPVFDLMNVKLYLHNKINDWDEFECANRLGTLESNWRFNAKNKDSGAYGVFQSMSDYAPSWDPYKQMDKAYEYINHRYDGSWCKALNHLEVEGWH